MWKLLSDFEEDILFRGSRIRVQLLPNHGEDDVVDFMVFHSLCSVSDGFSLLRVSGYNSGNIGVTLPQESRLNGANGVSVKWLKKHWKKWIPVDGKVMNIWVGENPASARIHKN